MLEPKKGTFTWATQENKPSDGITSFPVNWGVGGGKKKGKKKEKEMEANQVPVTSDFIAVTVRASAVRVVHIPCTSSTEKFRETCLVRGASAESSNLISLIR